MANAQVFIANNDQSSILDLLDILNFDIEEWATQAASEVERDDFELDEYESALPFEPVVESLLLVADVTGDSDYDVSDLRQLAIDLQHMRRKAKEWRDDVLRSESIWWHWNTKGESEKRALIHRIEFGLPGGFMSVMKRDQILLELTVVRHPHFEPLTADTRVTVSSSGGVAFGATVEVPALGDAYGRITSAAILPGATGTGQCWIGIKPYGKGISGFQPVWELEDGTVGTDTTSGAVTGASGGDALTCTFATNEDLTERVKILFNDVSGSNANHNQGRFLMLLRYQAEGAGVAYHVRLNQVFNRTNIASPVGEVYLNGEASPGWNLVPLGVITLPFGSGRDGMPLASGSIAYSGAMIEAARIDGSGGDDLIMDCLLPIPYNHSMHIEQVYSGAGSDYGFALTFENDQHISFSGNSNPATSINQPSPAAFINWQTPPEGGLAVVAFENDGGATSVQVTLDYLPRWALFNGD